MSAGAIQTVIFTGHALAARISAVSAGEVQRLGRSPVCAVLHDPGAAPSAAYLRRLGEMAGRAGVTLLPLDWSAPRHAAAGGPGDELAALARAPGIDAVLALSPLPPGLDPGEAALLIGAARDAEGLHPLHAGALLTGAGPQALLRLPATAIAARLCAEAILGDLGGAEICLVGASARIGRPLAMLLLDAGATPVICHALSRDLAAHTRRADLVISAAGVPGLIGRPGIAPGALAPGGRVLDVAVVRGPQGLTGDADQASLTGYAGLLSHVPDGIGPVTAACLIANVIAAGTGEPPRFA